MNEAAITALLSILGIAEGVPDAIRGFAGLLKKARAEGRELSPEEIAALRIDDDELSKQLDAAIAAARSNP